MREMTDKKKKVDLDTLQEKLTEVFKQAEGAALAADPGPGADGGTCNMDTPGFILRGVQKRRIEKAAEAAGLQIGEYTAFGGSRAYWLRTSYHGQANRRSTMMTAAQKILIEAAEEIRAFGVAYIPYGYYRMD